MSTLSRQLRKPSGFLGKLVAKMMNVRNKDSYTEIIAELELTGNESLFEIGYGPGLGISRIANQYPGCRISGIDFSDLMNQVAAKKNDAFIRKGRVVLHMGDFLQFEEGPEKYDRIFCLNVVYFWQSLDDPFKKIYSMLKPGGEYLIYMDHKDDIVKAKFLEDFNKFSLEEVEKALRQVGFAHVSHKLIKGYFIRARK